MTSPIARLRRKKQFQHRRWRRQQAKKQGYRCNGCKRHFSKALPATLDHIVPLSAGGENTKDNTQALCEHCHREKDCMEKKIKPPPDITGIIDVEPFWIVWNPAGRNPQARHRSYEKAAAEALRLARANPGEQFFAMAAAAEAKVPPVREPITVIQKSTEWQSKCSRTGQHMDHEEDFEPRLDPGIREAVMALREEGVETYESCQGGEGHAYPAPAIRFYGDRAEGFRALGIALQYGIPVSDLRRIWSIVDGEPTGPDWEIALFDFK